MKKFIFIVLLLMIPFVSSIGTNKVNTNISIVHPIRVNGAVAPTTVCDITVLNPDELIIVDFQRMTNTSAHHNYTVDSSLTDEIGIYDYFITCVGDGLNQTSSFSFEVTYTGKEPPGTNFIVVFSLIFILLSSGLFFLFLHSIAKGGKLEYDIKDLGFSWGFLFGLLALFIVFKNYWADESINEIIVWVISVAGVTNGFIPIVLFLTSIIFGTVKTQRVPDVWGNNRRRRR